MLVLIRYRFYSNSSLTGNRTGSIYGTFTEGVSSVSTFPQEFGPVIASIGALNSLSSLSLLFLINI